MKTFSLIVAALTSIVAVHTASAQTLTQSEIKKFKGVYAGEISGIAGNVSLPNNSTRFAGAVKVTGKRRELVPVLIAGLNARAVHNIVWRKPLGSTRRVKFVGFYTGSAINPITLLPEPVSGMRSMSIVDRGAGMNFRFVMRLSDTLREGAYSAQSLTGKLAKER